MAKPDHALGTFGVPLLNLSRCLADPVLARWIGLAAIGTRAEVDGREHLARLSSLARPLLPGLVGGRLVLASEPRPPRPPPAVSAAEMAHFRGAVAELVSAIDLWPVPAGVIGRIGNVLSAPARLPDHALTWLQPDADDARLWRGGGLMIFEPHVVFPSGLPEGVAKRLAAPWRLVRDIAEMDHLSEAGFILPPETAEPYGAAVAQLDGWLAGEIAAGRLLLDSDGLIRWPDFDGQLADTQAPARLDAWGAKWAPRFRRSTTSGLIDVYRQWVTEALRDHWDQWPEELQPKRRVPNLWQWCNQLQEAWSTGKKIDRDHVHVPVMRELRATADGAALVRSRYRRSGRPKGRR